MSDDTRYTPDNSAENWWDLADQLTAEQVAKLRDLEQWFRAEAASLPRGIPVRLAAAIRERD
jgi:hypothetical protein